MFSAVEATNFLVTRTAVEMPVIYENSQKRLQRILQYCCVLGAVFCLFPLTTDAEMIYLKNGLKVKGKIVEQDDSQVRVNVNGIRISYFLDEIEKIESDDGATVTAPPKPLGTPQPMPRLIPNVNESRGQAGPLMDNPAVLPNASVSQNVRPSADLNKQQLIWKLIEITGTQKSMQKIFDDMLAKAPADQVDQIKSVFNIDEIILQLIPIYDKYFSSKELQDMVNFYMSDSGQKFIQMTPMVTQESIQATLFYFQKKLDSLPEQ